MMEIRRRRWQSYLKQIHTEHFLLPRSIKMMKFLYLFIILAIYACDHEESSNPDPPPGGSGKLEMKLVWQSFLNDSIKSTFSISPILFEYKVIASKAILFSKYNEELVAFSQDSGKFLWNWSDHHPGRFEKGDVGFLDTYHQLAFGKFYLFKDFYLYGIDLSSGKTIWSKQNNSAYGINYFTNYNPLCLSTIINNDRSVNIDILNVANGDQNQIYKIDLPNEKGIYPNISAPVMWFDSRGDTILIFKTGTWGSRQSVNLVSYNLSAKTTNWEILDMDPKIFGSAFPPYIQDNLIFFTSMKTLFCVDKNTGKLIWKKVFSDKSGGLYLAESNLVFDETNVYLMVGNGNLVSLDKRTGNQNWLTDINGLAIGGIIYSEGKIIFSNRTLYIFEASSGKKLLEYNSLNQGKVFPDTYISDPTYDPVTKRIYFSDGYFLQCFQLIE